MKKNEDLVQSKARKRKLTILFMRDPTPKKMLVRHQPPASDVWIDYLWCYAIFYSVSVVSGWWESDNERLSAAERVYGWKDFCFQQESNPRPLDQQDSG